MGWTGLNLWFDKDLEKFGAPLNLNVKAYLDCLMTSDGERFTCKVLKSIMHGSTYYGAIEQIDKTIKKSIIFGQVILTQKQGHDFYYKEMTEFEGPYYYDCPVGILKLLSPTSNKYALEWRQQCEEKDKRKKKLKEFWKIAQDKNKVSYIRYVMPFDLDPDNYGYKKGDVAYLTYGEFFVRGKVRKCWSDGVYHFPKPKIVPEKCTFVQYTEYGKHEFVFKW